MDPKFIIEPKYNNEFRAEFYGGAWDSFQKQLAELIEQNQIATENLTKDQFISAVKQAVACGDFTRLVTPTSGQAVVYHPYSQIQILKDKIEGLNRRLEEYRKMVKELKAFIRVALEEAAKLE